MQATVPETPSPDVLTVSKPDVPLGRRMHLAAAGRNVDADSPAKGRVSKVPRTGMIAPLAGGGQKNAYVAVCSQVRWLPSLPPFAVCPSCIGPRGCSAKSSLHASGSQQSYPSFHM